MLQDSHLRSRSIWLVSEDGLWDICIGLLLFGIGVTIIIDQFIWLIGVFLLAYFLVLMSGKEAVTRPRLIYFDIQRSKMRKFTLTAVVDLVILILVMGISAVTFVKFDGRLSTGILGDYATIILGIIASILLIQFGILLTGGFRFFLYAGIIMLSFILVYFFNLPIVPIILAIGGVFALGGLLLLVRFIYKYPKSGTHGDARI